jgi:SAM-dependent methyltransferase
MRGRDQLRQGVRKRLRRLARPARFGVVRRMTPLSNAWGWDRGTPVDRYYIERFLAAHSQDIRGRVLEVKDSGYTERFGVGVTEREVLDVDPGNPLATIVANLAVEGSLPASTFDCFILTQTLHYIYDVRSAIDQAYRALKPSGVLLATVPGITPTPPETEMPWYWSFTATSCAALFAEAFGVDFVDVRGYGNLRTAIAFLAGMAYEELEEDELNAHDPRFTMLLSVRAVRPGVHASGRGSGEEDAVANAPAQAPHRPA